MPDYSKSDVDDKPTYEHAGTRTSKAGDVVEVSAVDNQRILRKTDFNILSLIVWVYFLQILDKSTLGYAALFGLQTDAHLHGNEYSIVASMNAIAQLCWMPFSSYFIVRIPPRILMPTIVFCWGVSLACMGVSSNYADLAATRFLLGLFEGACLPLFAVITSVWYRRAEQPLRVCLWYGTNGFGTMIGAALGYGLGHIKSDKLHSYQIIFLFTGLLTIVSVAWIIWKLDNNIGEARFLSPEDRKKAMERVKTNNTGTSANATSYKWKQALEAFLELKTWLFLAMTLLLNIGASVSNVFGPLILAGLGFDKYNASLLNIPFGAVQFIAILASSYVSYRYRQKSYMLAGLCIPVIIGLALLYTLKIGGSKTGVMLFGYYLLAFLFGSNPLIISWISANTAGSTKKSVTFSAYNAASAVGNIVGPYLFQSETAPRYLPGLKACLGIFCALFFVIILQMINLHILNRHKCIERVKQGKPEWPRDISMYLDYSYEASMEKEVHEAEGDFDPVTGEMLDLTDKENIMFVYVL